MVKLQPRDARLLDALSRYGVLSTKQIQKTIFPEIRFTTMMRRLRLLEKSHFIKRGIALTDFSLTWTLSYRGEQQLGVEIPGSFSNRNTIDHDVLINDIRLKLEEFNLAKTWKPEFELKSEAFRTHRYRQAKDRLIPDGILYEPKSGQPWAIAMELELTRKSENRYRRIFLEYSGRRDITRIWYFLRSTKEAKAILEIAEKTLLFDIKRLWFSVVDSFLKSDDPQVFSVNAMKWLKLSDIDFDNYRRINPAQSHAQGVSSQESKSVSSETESNPLSSCTNSQNTSSLRAEPSAADHSPSTMESGQQLQADASTEESELVQELEIRKCG